MSIENVSERRLIDHLLDAPKFIPFQPKMALDMGWFEKREHFLRGRISRAEVFEITNISDYFWSGTAQEEWDVFSDFPCVMPPFEDIWMEYHAPAKIVSAINGMLQWDAKAFRRCGILISTRPNAPDPPPEFTGAKHIQECDLFFMGGIGQRTRDVVGPAVAIFYGVRVDGVPLPTRERNQTILAVPPHRKEYAHLVNKERYNHFHVPLYPALLALTFLNCRNTAIIEHGPDKHLSDLHRRKHGRPLVTFRTLEIEPIKKLFREKAGPGETLQRALHICRGHFKDYREHGLFGHHKGMYWWGPQVRGSPERGSVIKDYAMPAMDDPLNRT